MSQNQYQQRWQQEAPVRQEYYGAESAQRVGRTGNHPQNHNQATCQQQGWQNGSTGYENYAAPQTYQQNGQWEDPYYQEQYQGGPHIPDPQLQYHQGQGPGRSYQYDDRYHTGGSSRPQQPHGDQAGFGQRPPEKHRPPPMNTEKRQKPRERILQPQPASPKEVGWDNPFPTFGPTKKKDHKKNHSSLDKGMNGLDLGPSRSAEQRPNTSQSHRRRDEARPHTSHGQRLPEPQDFETPRIPQPHPMSPPRQNPPRNKFEFDQAAEQYDPPMQAAGRPGPNPIHLPGSTGPPSGVQNGGYHQQSYPPPSMTMPDNVAGRGFQRSATGPPMSQTYAADPPNSRYYPNDQPAHRNPQLDQVADYQPVQKSRSHEPQLPNGSGYGGTAAHDRYVTTQEPQMQPDYHMPSQQISPHRYGGPDMPNFDAISPTTHEKEEIHLASHNFPPNGQPAYQKKPYQAPAPFQPQLDTRKTRTPDMSTTAQSPLADFSFGLPGNGPQRNQSGGPSKSQSYDDYTEQWTINDPYTQSPPNQRPGQYQTAGSDGARFPPRGASKEDQQPHSANDALQYPLPNPRGYQQQPPPNAQVRPNTSHGAGNRNQAFGQAPRPNLPAQNDYTQSDPLLPRGTRQPIGYPQPPPAVPQPNSRQPPPKPYEFDQDQRPKTAGSGRPPPVRHYGARTSSDSQRPFGQQNSFGSQPNPDALPAHPAPVRPGLAGNNGAPQSQPPPHPIAPSQANQMQQRGVLGQQPMSQSPVKATPPPVSVAELNSLQQAVKNNPGDYQLALKFAKKLVEAASVLSNDGGKADAKTTAKNRERYIMDAHKIVKKLVSASYPDAMFYLADCHGQGMLGLAADPKEAFSLYQSAAKLNHAPSAYRVAVCCEMGQEDGGGTRRDPLKAIQWYKRAATLGDTPAMYKMGMILLKGLLGQPRNPREALSWLKRAADRADTDNPHALHELGLLYESASGNDNVVRDEKYALQLFKQAADLGYKYSQFRLGSAFEYGILGCPIDARQSIAWYTRAATQSEHQSELALSGWYLTGSEGLMQQSDTEAYLWARKAASSGLAKAEYAMGYFTEVGIGVPANLEEAKRWYYRAASQDFPKARERLEELKRGGQKKQKTRVSRSAISKQNEGDCVVM